MKKYYKIFDSKTFDNSKWYEDVDGNVRVPVIVAQAGVLNYTYVDTDGKRVDVAEAKLPEELLSKHTVFSAEGKPVTLEHPEQMISPSNYQLHSKGVFINPKVVGDSIHGEIVIYDKELQDQIKSGERYQISPGFWSNTEYKSGKLGNKSYDAVQHDISFNHFAIVKEGRAGDSVRVKLDSNKIEEITKEVLSMKKKFVIKKRRQDMSEEEKNKIDEYEEKKEESEEEKKPETDEDETASEDGDEEDKKPETDEDGEMATDPLDELEKLKMENEMLKQELDKRDKKDSVSTYMEARELALKYVTDKPLNLYHNDSAYYKKALIEQAGYEAKNLSGPKLDGAFEVAKTILKNNDRPNVIRQDGKTDSVYRTEVEKAYADSVKLNSVFSGKRVVAKK